MIDRTTNVNQVSRKIVDTIEQDQHYQEAQNAGANIIFEICSVERQRSSKFLIEIVDNEEKIMQSQKTV